MRDNEKLSSKKLQAAHWFNQQKNIKVVIVKGAGRTFSAGADLDDFSQNSSEQETWLERRDHG